MKMNAPASNFIENDNIPWEKVEYGIHRKVMAYDEKLMLVKVRFEPGMIGTLHQHHHSQITQVESGVFEIQIDGHKKVLKRGDAYYIPPDTMHGAKCIEAGILIDVFSPMREDFIQ
ncbi:MAG TPA: cupin domain-containing protein [Puia sp.]|jgi:quercetin dioxygenase-like cupin family protein|nr:cupin domain-containing protein [Puia sp.]